MMYLQYKPPQKKNKQKQTNKNRPARMTESVRLFWVS